MGKNLLSTEEKSDLVKWYFQVKNDKGVKNKYKFVKKNLNQNIKKCPQLKNNFI